MRFPSATLLAGAVLLAPGAALAQMIIAEPPPMAGEMAVGAPQPMMPPPMMMGPPTVDDAAMIAMAHGMAAVEDVHRRFWDGNYEVDGTDRFGENIEMLIDADTGEVLEIDD